jgi:A/G-specific adenine glycosylase
LTHRDLHLHPVRLLGAGQSAPACEGQWTDAYAWPALGLPAPIRSLLMT